VQDGATGRTTWRRRKPFETDFWKDANLHGMNNFGLISRMITDWAYPAGAIHRRLETRWVKPVKPGDTIQPTGIVKSKQVTANSRWVLIDVMVRNQNDEKVASGEAMVEFP